MATDHNYFNILCTSVYVIIGSVLIYILKSCYEQYKKFMVLNQIPRPKESSFLFGHLKEMTKPSDELQTYFMECSKHNYPHYGIRILHEIMTFILSPEDVELVISSKKHIAKSSFYEPLRTWLRDGLLLSTGEKWTKRRKVLTPTFHFEILKNFIRTFNDEAENLLNLIASKGGEVIDAMPIISECTLFIINETAMGIQLDPKNEDQKAYRDAIHSMETIFLYKMMRPWLSLPFLYSFTSKYKEEQKLLNTLHNFTGDIIKKRMESFKGISELQEQLKNEEDDPDSIYMGKKKKKRLAMLDILLQAYQDGGQIDYEGIREEVDTFMFAGHDTTSHTLCYCLLLLANHPEIQEEVYEEIISILEDKNNPPSYEDLQKMALIERCIKESLRIFPTAYMIARVTEEDLTLTSGHIVPKGSMVHIHFGGIFHNPKIFPNPEKFDPDRFLPENSRGRHPYSFTPFSAGPRNCIGQKFAMLEMKALLSAIIKRFKIIAVDTPENLKLKSETVLRPKDGIRMKFVPRK